MTNTITEIRERFKDSPFISHIGLEIVDFQEGNIQLKLLVKEKLFNVNGTMHGGVHATVLDTVMGMTTRSITKAPCLTINLNIHYLSPSKSGVVYAKGSIIHRGYRMATVEGEMTDSDGTILAKGIGTFKLLRDKEIKEVYK
ncbi:acyl-CoA thioesterase [Salinibacillus kushneri]|uniref:Acyl-CoA thioesterase n=1 Tax=Salinibacillus kushneri TaxID=237682 RepID=A0A1I0DQA9_9BACI|nr:PaaI family thioesterase [Salinibacillus kushneri]SET34738.1 acyl-CoA thioesterase [Salinibacillus kushneri]